MMDFSLFARQNYNNSLVPARKLTIIFILSLMPSRFP